MKSRTWTWMTLLVVICLATSTVFAAAPIRVDCGRGGSINATLADLTKSGNTRGITIFVIGTCRVSVLSSRAGFTAKRYPSPTVPPLLSRCLLPVNLASLRGSLET